MTDIYIALGLVVIVVVVYLLSRMKLLPKKSLPYLLIGLGALLGLAIFRALKKDKILEEINKQKEEIEKRKEKLKELEKDADAAKNKLDEIDAELERKREAHEKQALLEAEELKKEKERIKNLSGGELLDEFAKAFGSGG
jgi:phenylalanyl-tRNA synthetase alpha subunit